MKLRPWAQQLEKEGILPTTTERAIEKKPLPGEPPDETTALGKPRMQSGKSPQTTGPSDARLKCLATETRR